MSGAILIRGAVLEEVGRPRPYAESRPLVVADLLLDPPGDGEVLVRVEAAGVCHSDLSVVDGSRVRPVPMLLGHEASGIVEAVGAGCAGVVVGDRVVMTFLPRCGECPGCHTGGVVPCAPGTAANASGALLGGGSRLRRDGAPVLHHLGVSAFATHAVVDRRSVVVVAPDVPADVACLLGCAVLTGGGAVLNAARPAPGDTVIVVGLGGVGMAALMTAIGLGGLRVVGVDTLPAKLGLASDLGADAALTPEELAAQQLRGAVVIEAAGHPRAFEAAVRATAPGGRTVTVGLPGPTALAEISPLDLVAQGRTIIGSYLGSAVPERDIPILLQMWRAGRLPVESLVSATITLDEINEAMDALADGRALRQLIAFS